jgi:hypothetical protein
VQFANTRVAVPRRANGPDPEPPLGVHEHESSGDRREHPLMPPTGAGAGLGTVAKHVSDACADLKKALPELAIADDPGGDAAGGEEAP